jgi:Protein of unknown function (DUF3987)
MNGQNRHQDPFRTSQNKRVSQSVAALEGDPELAREVEARLSQTINGEELWPDPVPLRDELPPVPSLDCQLLPNSLRPLVEDVSERMQLPPDYATAAAVVALAGCVNRRAVMRPKQHDTSWAVIPNLWGAIIAPPGSMKSPVLHAVTEPLERIEERWRAEFARESSEFELEEELDQIRVQAWREKSKGLIKTGKPMLAKPEPTRVKPVSKRLVLMDATFEKSHEILSHNPAGVLFIRDELTSWLAELDKQGRESERGFFLQAWNGIGGCTVDRIGRGSIYVPNVCVSLLGNIQPARLCDYLSKAVEGGAGDDGLFQRFQIAVWPDFPRHWQLVDRPPNADAIKKAERVYSTLANLSASVPVRLRFGDGAQSLFFEWLSELEGKVRGDSGLSPALVAHLAKYRSLMPTLAALFELADSAATENIVNEEMLVSLGHAQRAATFCDYLEAHARRVYSCAVSLDSRAARELGRHIRSGDLSQVFKTRDVYVRNWTGLGTADQARRALELLEYAEWVQRTETPPSPIGGRPPETWMVNPRLSTRAK